MDADTIVRRFADSSLGLFADYLPVEQGGVERSRAEYFIFEI